MNSRNILGTILFVVAIAFGAGVFWPRVQAVRSISVERTAKDQIATAKTKRLSSLQVLRGAFAQQPDRIAKILSSLPPDPQVPELLVTLDAMAKQNSVTLQSIVPQVNTHDQKVTVSIVGEGDLAATEKLVQSIADNDRPLSIDSVSFNRSGTSNRLSFSLSLSAPYIKVTKSAQGAL